MADVLILETMWIAKLAELLETNDPHTMVRFSTSEDVLRFPIVTRLYDERTHAPGNDVQTRNRKQISRYPFRILNIRKILRT